MNDVIDGRCLEDTVGDMALVKVLPNISFAEECPRAVFARVWSNVLMPPFVVCQVATRGKLLFTHVASVRLNT
jgi:hypothetical protein